MGLLFSYILSWWSHCIWISKVVSFSKGDLLHIGTLWTLGKVCYSTVCDGEDRAEWGTHTAPACTHTHTLIQQTTNLSTPAHCLHIFLRVHKATFFPLLCPRPSKGGVSKSEWKLDAKQRSCVQVSRWHQRANMWKGEGALTRCPSEISAVREWGVV